MKIIMIFSCFFLLMGKLVGVDLKYTPRELIVKTTMPINTRGNNFGIAELDLFLSESSVREIKAVTPSADNRFFVVRLEEEFSWDELRNRNLTFENVEYIQPNYLSTMFAEPNDPRLFEQVLHLIGLPEAWYYETGNNQIIVGIVDSGLWFEHPEFSSYKNIWINEAEYPPNGEDSSGNGYIDDWRGWNFVDAPEMADIAIGNYLDQDNDPSDETGHGTHVAGIVGAETNNGIGIAGVCWDVKMMILRAGFRTTAGPGMLQDDDAAAAIIYAVDNGAHVINLSWGSQTYSPIIADACQYAYERGVIIVASSGNIPQPVLMYPAKLNTTISVGSVSNGLNLSGFSSYGPDLDLVAPGENIMSTHIDQNGEMYRRLSGTSMSAPFVSAAIALLLSAEPGLSFNEVKSRLLTSTIDLGQPGFDNSFGHGLLNIHQLLNSTFNPYISISYPDSYTGLSETFDIIGTAQAPNFFRYSVMFSDNLTPTSLDWRDVYSHQNFPRFFYQEVYEDVMATFFVPYTLGDGEYLIRIRLETITGEVYEERKRIQINKSTPQLHTETLSVIKRFRDDIPFYFTKAVFDQEVNLELEIFSESGVTGSVYSNYPDFLHYLQVPDYIPQGNISIRLKAISSSGLEYQSPLFENIAVIDKTPIPTDTFFLQPIGPPSIAAGKSLDFNGNGMMEFAGMEIYDDGSYGFVNIYEYTGSSLEVKYTFAEKFLPLDVGNTNNLGTEIIGRILDSIVLYDTYGGHTYPNIALWSVNDAEGGNFADFTNDGTEDLLIVRNHQNRRVVSLYQRSGNIFVETNTLSNTTETTGLNTFVPRIATGDLNNNGYKNVLAADTDGDVMVFEVYGAASDSLIWHTRLPVPDAYHLAISDFTGDGDLEFVVGGYKNDYEKPDKTFWYFEFFKFLQDDFVSLGYVAFDHFESVNSIRALDIVGDGKNDLVLALTPHLYVISYVNGKFEPVWKGESATTYQIVPMMQNSHHPTGVIVNAFDGNNLRSHFVTLTDYNGPTAPSGLSVQPVNESTIDLTWHHPGADHFLVFRKTDDNIALVDTTYSTTYTDTGLNEGVEYHYAVKAVDNGFHPTIESLFSTWKSATPFAVPNLIKIEMTSVNELFVLFDTQLSNDAINNGNFHVNNGMGTPHSVIHGQIHHALILRFQKAFVDSSIPYVLEINGLRGRSGVPFPDSDFPFAFIPDLVPPRVDHYEIVDGIELHIQFTKDMNSSRASEISNYELNPPQIDLLNEIVTVTCTGSTVVVIFKEELKYSTQSYYIKMSNLEDLGGNRLPNNQNILKFQLMQINNLDYVQVVPNPLVRNQPGHSRIQFIGLPAGIEGQLQIYNLSGESVYSTVIHPLTDRNSYYLWGGVNNANKNLSSGIYFYILKMGNHIKRGQIGIVN